MGQPGFATGPADWIESVGWIELVDWIDLHDWSVLLQTLWVTVTRRSLVESILEIICGSPR